ncbi:hypothetical protein [Paramicrobacterium fandaimingii]|uniref:AraC-like ligand-binding domain-containing protein n=1 Tax=Paramicrobacterium fandaimingii TaxID=2708079 RepID=UPI001422D915|nr:hypothetical protein [Microbacterium fandaimingii]
MFANQNQESAELALKRFGWTPTSSTSSLLIEGVGRLGFQVGRAWSPKGEYASIAQPGGIFVLLAVEGGAWIEYGGEPVPVSASEFIFLDGDTPIRISLRQPTARYIWRFDATVLRNPLVEQRMGQPLPLSSGDWGTAAALTNSLLSADTKVGGSFHAAKASEHLLSALFENATRSHSSSAPGTDQVFSHALSIIEERFQNPSFRVADLAKQMLVSERTLRRSFALMGTTVRKEIEKRRVQELGLYLQTPTLITSKLFKRYAEASGFSSATHARAALERLDAQR